MFTCAPARRTRFRAEDPPSMTTSRLSLKRRKRNAWVSEAMATAAKSIAIAILALVGMGLRGGAFAQDAEGSIELVDPHVFRACADPHDLPYSNEAGEGFENKIAELFAKKLGKSLAYTFYPDATGFIRMTLNARRCDVVLGIAQEADIVQPTNPYYRTAYVAVYRKSGPLAGLD